MRGASKGDADASVTVPLEVGDTTAVRTDMKLSFAGAAPPYVVAYAG